MHRPRRLIAGLLLLLAALPLAGWAACDSSHFRWASSSGNFYITGPVTCTLTDINTVNRPEVLELVDPGNKIWMLRANLRLEEGARLNLHGSAIGGDVDELRMASPGAYGNVYIRADWGTVDIRSTTITSWDESAGTVDSDSSDGRAYIHVRSRLIDGVPRESRMDVIDSEVKYLGHYAAEAYGLVWKVMGGVFDQVDVYGDIKNSYIHHNYMGMYSYGAYGMQITDNEVAYNESYGIDPHDDSDSLVITGNNVHDNGNHGIICSRRCDHLTISNNTSVRNRHGIMLHRDTNDSTVENNVVTDNTDTGIVLFESHRNVVRNNEVRRNRHGIRLSLGSHDNLIENNVVTESQKYGFYFFMGSDPPDTTDGRPRNNTFRNNWVENFQYPIKLTDADDNLFENNTFVGGGEFKFYRGVGNELRNNSYSGLPTVRTASGNGINGYTVVTTEGSVVVKLDQDASARVRNDAQRIYLPDESALQVVATPSEAYMDLDYGLVGSQSYVQSIEFFARPVNGTVTVDAIHWDQNQRQWDAQASQANDDITWEVGELLAATDYKVTRDGNDVGTYTTNASGVLQFTDSPGTTGTVTYLVTQAGGGGQVQTLEAIADAYVRDGSYADSNYGGSTLLKVKKSGSGYNREAYIKFDISSVPGNPQQVLLRLHAKLTSPDAADTTAYAVSDNSWTESGITWNNRPAAGSALDTRRIDKTGYRDVDFDVTSYVAGLRQQGINQASFVLKNDFATSAIVQARSRETSSADQRPRLVVTE